MTKNAAQGAFNVLTGPSWFSTVDLLPVRERLHLQHLLACISLMKCAV